MTSPADARPVPITGFPDRFVAKISFPESGCWIWTGATVYGGYGSYWDGIKNVRAHRFSWALVNGDIPAGKFICHHCDVTLCVNPEHLFLGDEVSNIRDMIAKGRRVIKPSFGERNGSAKLSTDRVKAIRASRLGPSVLASQYGVNPDTIYRVKTRQSWSHV